MRKPRYRLIQDLPVGDTEDIAFEHNDTILVRTSDGLYDTMLPGSLLCNTLLFEEISEDNAHWKPKEGDDYYYIVYSYNPLYNEILVSTWIDDDHDRTHYLFGNIYRSYEEAEKARNRKLAEVRLRRTSAFKPDFENGNGGWFIAYNHLEKRLEYFQCSWQDAGEPVRYETREDAEKSIEENERDWKIYFGIEEKANASK